MVSYFPDGISQDFPPGISRAGISQTTLILTIHLVNTFQLQMSADILQHYIKIIYSRGWQPFLRQHTNFRCLGTACATYTANGEISSSDLQDNEILIFRGSCNVHATEIVALCQSWLPTSGLGHKKRQPCFTGLIDPDFPLGEIFYLAKIM